MRKLRGEAIRRVTPGYTMVEFLLAGGIMVMMLGVVTRMFVEIVELRLSAQAKSALAQNERYLLSRLSYDLARAEEVVVPVPGATGEALQLVIGGESYTYGLSGDTLSLTSPSYSGQVSSGGVRVVGLEFIRPGEVEGADAVRFEIGLETEVETVSGRKNRQLISTVRIR